MRLSGWEQYDLFLNFENCLDQLAVHLGGVSLSEAVAIDERTEDEKLLTGIVGKGVTYYFSGEFEKSLSLFETAINIEPYDDNAWNSKGVALSALGRHDEALEAYNKAIEIKPDLHEAWYNKGNTLNKVDRPDEALEAYDKAIEIKTDKYEAWYNKGVTLAALGRRDEALEAYNKAIAIKPDLHEAWYNKGVTLAALGRRDEALEAYNKAIEIKPDYHNAWNNKGNTLYELGLTEEALEAYNKAIEIKPDGHLGWYYRGIVLRKLGRNKDARNAYLKAVELRPKDTTDDEFPYVMQDEPVSCGAACLKMICNYYGKDYDLEYLKKIINADTENGVSMLDVSEAAESLEFRTMGVRINFGQLEKEVLLPCIAHWKNNYFLVVYKITKDAVFVSDPDPLSGKKSYSKELFCFNWIQGELTLKDEGLALLMEPKKS